MKLFIVLSFQMNAYFVIVCISSFVDCMENVCPEQTVLDKHFP